MPPATPRPAASLILLRDTEAGLEVLVGWRRAGALAFPGVVAFPGGKIEAGDPACEQAAGGSPPWPAPPGAAFAALRETFEETGLWLTSKGDGDPPFPERPGLARLIPYAHWITPETRPYRFDTWFFLAVATETEARATLAGDEFEAVAWSAPARILEDHGVAIMTPTRHSLERLASRASTRAAIADALTGGPFEAGDFERRDGGGRAGQPNVDAETEGL